MVVLLRVPNVYFLEIVWESDVFTEAYAGTQVIYAEDTVYNFGVCVQIDDYSSRCRKFFFSKRPFKVKVVKITDSQKTEEVKVVDKPGDYVFETDVTDVRTTDYETRKIFREILWHLPKGWVELTEKGKELVNYLAFLGDAFFFFYPMKSVDIEEFKKRYRRGWPQWSGLIFLPR